eukprot:CAMPEP_0195071660 /NCGR_PEP_ID=MMETSP0448-20130528/15408_1 /TAXON_ID=66468 /ORGANISM="Heterocapsa triquestra, Strain CCMP 448" /LENGTH=57 /DNA_ID=CAMNT_0040103543 /DNA_START=72 /DNA_END=242 /DNA_ORIENTATION=+
MKGSEALSPPCPQKIPADPCPLHRGQPVGGSAQLSTLRLQAQDMLAQWLERLPAVAM